MRTDTNGQRILLSVTRPLALSGKVWQGLTHEIFLVNVYVAFAFLNFQRGGGDVLIFRTMPAGLSIKQNTCIYTKLHNN